MKIILSHSGKQHSYHVAKSLHELGYLSKFYTSSYVRQQWLQDFIIQMKNKFWSRRFLTGLHDDQVESNWRFELKEILYGKLFGPSVKALDIVYDRDVKFDRFMADRMADLEGDIFWGFQGSCYESLRSAKEHGKTTICELSAAHAPAAIRIFSQEQNLHPEWSDSFSHFYFPEPYYRRLCEEPLLADIALGASSFTLQTLIENGVPSEKVKLLPLGFDLRSIPFNPQSRKKREPLKVLYAGRITQGKGIKYLLEAIKLFNRSDVELHLIGHVQGSGKALNEYREFFTLHSPLQQIDLFSKYNEYDVLVLPSLFEGFGLVILEAMAAGLPVITTPNTMGPDLIVEGFNGYIVPIQDAKAIANAISNFAKKNLIEREEMRLRAHESALNFTWQAYQQRLRIMLETL